MKFASVFTATFVLVVDYLLISGQRAALGVAGLGYLVTIGLVLTDLPTCIRHARHLHDALIFSGPYTYLFLHPPTLERWPRVRQELTQLETYNCYTQQSKILAIEYLRIIRSSLGQKPQADANKTKNLRLPHL